MMITLSEIVSPPQQGRAWKAVSPPPPEKGVWVALDQSAQLTTVLGGGGVGCGANQHCTAAIG
jgi:hypothetical protein